MKKISVLPLLIALTILCSCQKQESDAERQAEIDRQVQQRLDAEHQSQEKEKLAQRESELDAREKALGQKDATAESTPVERERESDRQSSRRDSRDDDQQFDERRPGGSYDTFYTKLDSYGDWRETSDYGYVFQPRQAQGSRTWRPYTEGRWVYTDAGWTWISEEPFGWATYHYGRWIRLRNIGWVWIPGEEWAPAWVSWRKSDDYVGWAPLPPEAQFDRRTGIHNWADNYYDIGPEQYCFVATREFGEQRIDRTVVPIERNVTIINQTTNVTNITYNNTTVVNQGPNFDELRTRTQRPIERLRLERDVNVNVNVGGPSSVVRGEVIAIPAPIIRRAQPARRPVRLKETIAHVDVERGWDAIPDRQAADQARVKMRAEATPPPNAPSKIFVRPTVAEVTQSASVVPMPSASQTAVPLPSSSPVRQRGIDQLRERAPKNASPTPAPSLAPATTPLATPFRRTTPEMRSTPLPTAAPSATTAPIATPSATVQRPNNPPHSAPRLTAMPSATTAPLSDDGAGTPLPRPMLGAPKPRPAETTNASPFLDDKRSRKQEKREWKEERREMRGQAQTPTPTPVAP